MKTAVLEKVMDIISTQLDVKIRRDAIQPSSILMEEGLGLDSIAIIELVTLVEEQFSIKFQEQDLSLDTFRTVSSLATFVEQRVSESDAGRTNP